MAASAQQGCTSFIEAHPNWPVYADVFVLFFLIYFRASKNNKIQII